MSKEKSNFFLKKYKNLKDIKTPVDNNKKDNISKINPQKKSFEKLQIQDKKKDQFNKIRLSAIYFILIGIENASNIIKHLNDDETEKIILEILQIEKITDKEIEEAGKLFGKTDLKSLASYKDGQKYAQQVLQKSFGMEKGSKYFVKIIESKNKDLIDFINKLSIKKTTDLIKDESDIVASVIFSMLDSKKVAEIINNLPKDRTINILKRMSKSIEISPDILKTIIEKLKQKITNDSTDDQIKIHGREKLVEILKYSTLDKASEILDDLENDLPTLAHELRDKLFTFEDIITIPKKSLIHALKNYKDQNIAFMLKGAEEKLKNFFFSCITKKRKLVVLDEIKFLGKVKKSDVDEKRKEFIDYLKYLEGREEIILNQDIEEYVE